MNTPYTCPHCHTNQILAAGQQFCVHCRERFAPAPPPATGRPLPVWTNPSDEISAPIWMPPDRTRPLGVTLIALRFLFITLSGVIATCGLNSRFSGYDIPFPLLACLALPPIIAIASLVAAGGLMDMRAWARNLAIGIMVVDMLSPLGFAPAGGVTSPEQSAGILGAWIVDIIVLVYLLRPSISERFE